MDVGFWIGVQYGYWRNRILRNLTGWPCRGRFADEARCRYEARWSRRRADDLRVYPWDGVGQ